MAFLKSILIDCVSSCFRNIGGGIGRKLRYWHYRKILGKCGKRVIIDTNVIFVNPQDIYIGNDVWIDRDSSLIAGKPAADRKVDIKENPDYNFKRGELHIGDQVHIGPQVILQAHGGMSIGRKLTIGAGSKIYTLSHHYRNTLDELDKKMYFFGSMVPESEQFLIESAIVVKDGAAIGMNCVLFPGSIVPEATWIGPGVILKNIRLDPSSVYQVDQILIKKELKK